MQPAYKGDGWVRLTDEDFPGPLFLRLEPDERGRYRVVDLIWRSLWRPLVAADLRELNLAGIEEWLQADAEWIERDPDDPDGPGSSDGRFDDELDRWSRDAWPWTADMVGPTARVERLQRPTNGLTDDFLRHVAAAHRQAVLDRLAPAPELARQVGDGATARTIHKWVAIARQRGLMPPAARRRGRDHG